MDVAADDASLQRRQHCKLYASGKATGIREMLAAFYCREMRFGQSIDEIMLASNAEVLSQVDNLDTRRNLMLLQELLALAVSEAEEDDIHFVERHFRSEAEFCLANQSLVYFTHRIACIALAIGKDYLNLRMPKQHTDEFASCVACCS